MEEIKINRYLELRKKIKDNILKLSKEYAIRQKFKYRSIYISLDRELIESTFYYGDSYTRDLLMMHYEAIMNIEKTIEVLINYHEFKGIHCAFISHKEILTYGEIDFTIRELIDYFKLKLQVEWESKEVGRIFAKEKNIEYYHVGIYMDYDSHLCIRFPSNSNDGRYFIHEDLNIPYKFLSNIDKWFDILLKKKSPNFRIYDTELI